MWVRSPVEEMKYLFLFSFLRSGVEAAFSTATQHSMRPGLRRKWETAKNENINVNKYFIFSSGDRTHDHSIHSYSPLRHDWSQISYILLYISIYYINVSNAAELCMNNYYWWEGRSVESLAKCYTRKCYESYIITVYCVLMYIFVKASCISVWGAILKKILRRKMFYIHSLILLGNVK